MAYLVRIARRAEHDLEMLFLEKQVETSSAARKWYVGLRKAILGLERLPTRSPHAAENSNLRNLLYGRKPHVYRVIYRVMAAEQTVVVLHIRYGARRPLKGPGADQL